MTFEQIAAIFKEQGYFWTFKDGRRNPTADEIEEVFHKGVEALRETEGDSQLEVGRLIVKRAGSYYDLYLHVGEHHQDLPAEKA